LARMTGTGPVKSFPVIMESVCMSEDGIRVNDTGVEWLRFTIWNPIFETVVDALRVFLVLRLEFGFASLSIAPREDIRHQFVILSELRESL